MNWPGAEAEPLICLHDAGPLPAVEPADFDLFLTSRIAAPAPWVVVSDPLAARRRVLAAVAAHPVAAAMVLRLLRLTAGMAPAEALEVESLAYSTLLGGAEFRRWLARRGPVVAPPVAVEPVTYQRDGNRVTLTLDDPGSHNACSARMRDALVAALDTCLIDPTRPEVVLRGAGRVFSQGGALWEFGQAADPAQAHLIRRAHSVTERLFRLGGRACARIDGAALGAGIEMAAAVRIEAGPGAWFQLPELAMGLIPGAGGTVTIPRRIGRHRAAWLMLTGRRIGAVRALDWGLVDRMVTP